VTDFAIFFMKSQVPKGNPEFTAEFLSKITIAKGTYGGTPIPSISLTQIVLYK
jgi:hypothetical protein